MNLANTYQQRPEDGNARAESPLFFARRHEKASSSGQVKLIEKTLLGHLMLRGDASNPAFASAVEQVLGLALPAPLSVVYQGEISLQWLAADEWLLIVPSGEEFATEQRLREAMPEGLHFSVVNVSGGQTLLELSGAKAQQVLMKSTVYDVHPRNFPIGKAVGSTFAKSQLLIRKTAEETWELVIRRSFADYFWAWLVDASAEYGLQTA